MQIYLNRGLCEIKKQSLTNQNVLNNQTNGISTIKSDTIPFMSIPSIAFKGRLVIPTLPKGMKALPEATVTKYDKDSKKGNKLQQEVQYRVNPQDPMITKPELYTMNGAVMPGPESNRVRTIDPKSSHAEPDENGNFVYDENTEQFDRVNSYLFTEKTLKLYEKNLGREIPWAFPGQQIKVHPRAGVMMNAYYSRWDQEIKLFYFNSETNPEEVCYTGKMADVIVHETGHAVLDGLRPNYLSWGGDGKAIHEGFGDASAMLVALSNEKLIDRLIESTGGDLRKENIVASLAEQFGTAIYGDKQAYIRNAIHDLKMSDFESGKESKEVHNFGRLAAGTFYDIMEQIALKHKETIPLKEALVKTTSDLSKIIARAMGDFGPIGMIKFNDLAFALITADKRDFDGEYADIIKKVFIEREIVKPKEIATWEKEMTKMPAIKLPAKTMDGKNSVEKFLEKHKATLKLPENNKYELQSAYSNIYGETFMHLRAPRIFDIPDVDPSDPMSDGTTQIMLYDCITLAFDKEGKLFYKAENETTAVDIDDAIIDVQNTIKKMQLAADNGLNIKPLAFRDSSNPNILIKAPVLEDPI